MTKSAVIRWSAHLLAGVTLGLGIGTIVLVARAAAEGQSESLGPYAVGGFVSGVAFPIVGWVIARRQPSNAIGWIFLLIGLSQALDTFNGLYSTNGLLGNAGSWPLAAEASWATKWDWAPGYTLLLTLSVLLFPDGRLPDARWRPVIWLTAIALLLLVVPTAIAVWPYRGVALTGEGPLGPVDPAVRTADALQVVGLLLSAVAALGSVAALVFRFRRSRGVERRQLTWFCFAGAIEIVVAAVAPFLLAYDPALGPLVALGVVFSAPLLPVAAGMAILRYRLYEIDRIVSRTVSYAVVTAVLGAVFVGAILVLQALLAPFTAGSPVAVAASTLLVATLFQPFRRRVQQVVDRRFNRSRYDAYRTAEVFATRLRDSVDLGHLRGDVADAVTQTLAPSRVGVWIRGPDAGSLDSAGARMFRNESRTTGA